MVFADFFIRVPSRSIQMYDALKDVGDEEAVLVTYPELGHGCWDEAFSMAGLFGWLFGKKKLGASAAED